MHAALHLLGDTSWFFSVFAPQSVPLTVLIISLVAASGLAMGSLNFRGLSLGIPGVMFTGLFFGLFFTVPDKLNGQVIQFVRDFGLILFVYAVGVQVGPGFLASLRKSGLPLNLMAVVIVLFGAVLSLAVAFGTGMSINAAVGLFAGASTNAPALGSAQEALKSIPGSDGAGQLTGPAFAISYPFGLMGVILAMVVLRAVFRTHPQQEAEALAVLEGKGKRELATRNIEVCNANLNGLTLGRIAELHGSQVVVSRVLHGDTLVTAAPELTVALGDVLLAVGPAEKLDNFCLIIGKESKHDLRAMPSNISTRKILVTHRAALGKAVPDLDLEGVTITRVARATFQFTPNASFRLQFGDQATAVGEPAALDKAAAMLGNSVRELNHPRLLPIFLGIALGVFIGSIPIMIPGLPAPVKLGLASGPLIVSIILARIGRVGPVIWYMPHNASQMLRELGIVLFLIAVGLLSGEGFFHALQTPVGFQWLGYGAAITLVPLLVVGLGARWIFKVNYLHICGMLAGSMTSPSLAFTSTMTPSEAPAMAFATVYPLTMILRVLLAQLMVLIFSVR